MERLADLQAWLAQCLPNTPLSWSDPIGDASSRRYFRLTLPDGTTRIAMDAPPPQDIQRFAEVAALLGASCHVPKILQQDVARGFMLLEDLGATDYQTALQGLSEDAARPWYRAAIDSLIALQQVPVGDALSLYDADNLGIDLDRFTDWYISRHLGVTLSDAQVQVWQRLRAFLVTHAATQARVLIHFDFHCRNLIVSQPNPGVIDFQDARLGPISYDLASLLKDVYLVWDEAFRLDLCIDYWEKARRAKLPVPATFDDFYRDFELMGVYRHLRTLGTFARLAHRDGKPAYIDHMPLTLEYLRATAVRYSELHPLYKLLNQLTGYVPQTGYTF